ncbi:putative UDP-glucose lipid carrier transferase [Deinococcus aerius]|uniref:Putative UDP-glucose lipid carrier transferase n=1 Tax=Deinococcus aerius TaxID=200253 RepID=A0A2I9CXC0_9DEIO|nr:exopolysaccharide biosynthesis polyprenyl glycosylphosphotransferase [Deinococcus aerius]GBF06713.1 putative UDP-glucose lipid carrier transferase [Deinococcus aerius]
MIVNRFHPSQHSHLRLKLLTALTALDLGAAALLSLLLGGLMPGATWAVAALWLLATWTAWVVTRENRHALALDPYARAVTTPLLAAVLALGLAGLSHLALPPGEFLLLPLVWGMTMILARLALRRMTPPVLIGTSANASHSLPHHSRVHYVRLDAPREVTLREVDALLLDPSAPSCPEWLELVLHAQASGTPVWTPATLGEELHGRVALEHLHTGRMDQTNFDDTYAVLKRLFDIVAVLAALPVLLPLLLVVALLVALDAGRPVLFWQWRVGQHGRPFRIAKFRTMKRDSEKHGAAFAQAGDLRVTRLGGYLRKFRLDELPQFWNVLRGDMSIIGPRPEQQAFVEQFERELHLYPVRHWVKPGITGWAQVTHGYASGADETLEKLRYDLYYIKNFSFWMDARIVAKTLWTICTGFGAR